MGRNDELASEELMEQLKTAGADSICHVLSRIYFSTEDEDVKLDARKAVWMAKRMATKLKLIRRAGGVKEFEMFVKKAWLRGKGV